MLRTTPEASCKDATRCINEVAALPQAMADGLLQAVNVANCASGYDKRNDVA